MAIPQQNIPGVGTALQLPKFGPNIQKQINPILQQGLAGFQQRGDFQPIADLARRQFNTKTIPSLAERLSSSGGLGSGSYRNALGEAGSDLETKLAALGSQHGMQQNQQLLQLLQASAPENILQPEGQGMLGSLFGGLGTGVGAYGTQALLGGLGGEAAGAGATAAGAGGLAALAAQPWFWPVLAALGAGAGAYGLYNQFSD